MNYEEARKYLTEVTRYGSVPGLDSIRELMRRLGNPQDKLKFIHIAGTNGKGSVLAYLSTILKKAGYRTVAWLYFAEKNCDIVVLETGMGGRLDATNIVQTTVLEILTSVSMDHMEFLGDTLAAIAGQKAGIIKPHTAVVSAPQEDEAMEVIEKTCRDKECTLHTVDQGCLSDVVYGWDRQKLSYRNWKDVEISLAGRYQIQNAMTALEAVNALRELEYKIADSDVYEGMRETVWRGRFTVIRKNPAVILDGAHNPAAARELKASLEQYFSGRTLRYIFGMFRDKDHEKVIELTAPLAEHIITVETPDNVRATPAETLKKEVAGVNPSVEAAKSIADAVEKTFSQASPEDVIVIFGSLSFLGEAERAVQSKGAGQ